MTAPRASTIRDGNAYLPCIRGANGRVLWQSAIRCRNRDESTATSGVAAKVFAALALKAATNPDELRTEASQPANGRTCPTISAWDRQRNADHRNAVLWAMGVADEVSEALAREPAP